MKVVITSGYFDPLHKGHLELFQMAKTYGGPDATHVVIVNNDEQTSMKKGKPFMQGEERLLIIQALRLVDEAFLSIDKDRSVCESLRKVREMYPDDDLSFCNGGDRFDHEVPEKPVCEECNIEMVDGLGEKIQSSSWLLKQKK